MAQEELDGIKEELREVKEAGTFTWREVVSGPALTALFSSALTVAGQNLSGINYFVNFTPAIANQL